MESTTNLSKTRPAFRTSGAITGNFGKAKVKSGSSLNEVPANKRDSLGNFPRVDEYAERVSKAYSLTSDHKLKSFILAELGKIERTRIDKEERYVKPQGAYCSLTNHYIQPSQL